MPTEKNDITIFLVVMTGIVVFLAMLIIAMIYLYKKRYFTYQHRLHALKSDHEKNTLTAQLEIQENTFQFISREIHDNISLTLTLAKLNLNTFDWNDRENSIVKVNTSVDLLSRAIVNLSDISKGLNSEVIANQGLIKALENELSRIRITGLLNIHFNVTGEPIYLDTQKELLIFRIIQEGFNNIIKHAKATQALLKLHFAKTELHIVISDNGNGFPKVNNGLDNQKGKAGLKNMNARTKMIGGRMQINSDIDGTSLLFNIPI